ncbi:hypothetical protein LTR49_028915, partial [Elasticomyces elasticus]
MAATGSARAVKEKFRRQRDVLASKAHHISAAYHADVYILVVRRGRWYSCKSCHAE